MNVFYVDKVLRDNSYLFSFDKNGKIISVMESTILDGPLMISWIDYPNGNLKEVYLTDEGFVIGIARIYYENGNKLEEIPYFEGKKNDLKKME